MKSSRIPKITCEVALIYTMIWTRCGLHLPLHSCLTNSKCSGEACSGHVFIKYFPASRQPFIIIIIIIPLPPSPPPPPPPHPPPSPLLLLLLLLIIIIIITCSRPASQFYIRMYYQIVRVHSVLLRLPFRHYPHHFLP